MAGQGSGAAPRVKRDIERLKKALDTFNAKYPRPGMPPLELSDAYFIETHYAAGKSFPNNKLPGVYAIFNTEGELLRLGKASCNSTLGVRLATYFRGAKNTVEWVPVAQHEGYDERMFIHTVGFPKERSFEAPALEEFLIHALTPPYNSKGSAKAARVAAAGG